MLLTTLGYHKKALKEAELAFELDPLNASISYILAFAFFNNNQFELAIEQHNKTLEIDPDFGDTWNSLAWMYVRSADYEKALEIFNKNLKDPTAKTKAIAGLGYTYAKKEQPEKAKEFIKQLERLDSEEVPLDIDFAIIYSGLGEWDRTFSLLNNAVDKKLGGLNFIKGKYWQELHDHPKFKDILIRMNLPLE
jgi:tetratricopeptide (TPR) repeat protein